MRYVGSKVFIIYLQDRAKVLYYIVVYGLKRFPVLSNYVTLFEMDSSSHKLVIFEGARCVLKHMLRISLI